MESDLYKLGVKYIPLWITYATPFNITLSHANLWHLELGHINKIKLKQSQQSVSGLDNFNEQDLTFRESCVKGKQHRVKFLKYIINKTHDLLDLIHGNICGPLK
jgi:hypothetical protein